MERKKSDNSEKSNKKSNTSTTNSNKRLPFIGRMPVLKKQSTEDGPKRAEYSLNEISEEEKIIQKKKQDELKFHLHQTKQFIHQQQKQAEAFNLMHPGHIENIYHTHGTIHHVLPVVQEDYDDLMPDPMQYVSMMAPPPPPVEGEPQQQQPQQKQQQQQQPQRFEEPDEPVLPPGIDEEEVANMETVVPDVPAKDVLPKDFQDALSIIFDKDRQESELAAAAAENKISDPANRTQDIHDENSTYAPMDIAMDTHEQQMEMDGNAVLLQSNVELDEQSQYMLYGQMTEQAIYGDIQATDIGTQSVHLDAAGNLVHSGSVLEMGGTEYVENATYAAAANDRNNDLTEQTANIDEINSKNKRLQELDDLAMLGIDAEDLAAQCI